MVRLAPRQFGRALALAGGGKGVSDAPQEATSPFVIARLAMQFRSLGPGK